MLVIGIYYTMIIICLLNLMITLMVNFASDVMVRLT